jgi:hypothetical protein
MKLLTAIHDLNNEDNVTLTEDRLKEFEKMFRVKVREKNTPQQAAQFLLNEMFIPYKE